MIDDPADSLRVSNAELATVREAMRDLSRLLAALEHGELDKVVLTQKNQMRAVLITPERYSQLESRDAQSVSHLSTRRHGQSASLEDPEDNSVAAPDGPRGRQPRYTSSGQLGQLGQ